ncbi:hypothetical protein FOS14_19200 [Skermania sp. ID1734]|uniref:DUF6918 family protein n=1 Tax=Skermania sp. ID1734 TaxID=2597516 RepID=UPI001180A088|nr:hypothetical protein [Skermania sp. ID1734]TSD95111.1 hypothetical protein FOS14_19200 [Skermania sp. ID1734]
MVVAVNESLLADVHALIDAEVAGKRGASGLAVKGGYAAVQKVSPTIVPEAIDALAPQLFEQLEPFWGEFRDSDQRSFGAFLTARSDAAAEALLSVTDRRVAASSRQSIKKVYGSMRPAARKHVIEALPALGDLVQRHAGE